MRGRLIWVRHGQSEGNAARRFTTSDAVPLTDLGRAQARRSAELIRARFRPERLLASPFARALETAQIIGEALGLRVEVEHDVREQHLGALHGQPYDAALRSPGFDRDARWAWRPPGGETLLEVQARAVPALVRAARAHPESDVVIASHHGTIQSVWAHVRGGWEHAAHVPNCALLVVPHDGSRFGPPELVAVDED